jgi:hypothetical protein
MFLLTRQVSRFPQSRCSADAIQLRNCKKPEEAAKGKLFLRGQEHRQMLCVARELSSIAKM